MRFGRTFSKEKFVFYIAKLTKGDFGVLRDLMQSGKVSPVIDEPTNWSRRRMQCATWKKAMREEKLSSGSIKRRL